MSEIDYILQLNKTAEFKADRIYSELLIAYPDDDLESNFWQNEKLALSIKNFLLVYQWIAFEDYESFHVALSLIYTDKMLEFLSNELQLTELAENLQNLNTKIDLLIGKDDYSTKMNELIKSKDFIQTDQFYYQQKSIIFDRLIEYVTIHHQDFP